MIAYIDEHGKLQLVANAGEESDELVEWWGRIFTQQNKLRKNPNVRVRITYYEDP